MLSASSAGLCIADLQLFIMLTLQLQVSHWDGREECFQEVGGRTQVMNSMNTLHLCRRKLMQFSIVSKFLKIRVGLLTVRLSLQ